MKTLSGTVYRASGGYWHCRDTTIANVLAFEREEPGNEDQLPNVPETVLEQSAKHCAWIALDRDIVACYSDTVIEIELDNAIIHHRQRWLWWATRLQRIYPLLNRT